jgi:hypothetical protein
MKQIIDLVRIYYKGEFAMNEMLLLNEVSKRLGLSAHKVSYAISSRKVPEPKLRIANKRIFQQEDVVRLAQHFGLLWDKEDHEG